MGGDIDILPPVRVDPLDLVNGSTDQVPAGGGTIFLHPATATLAAGTSDNIVTKAKATRDLTIADFACDLGSDCAAGTSVQVVVRVEGADSAIDITFSAGEGTTEKSSSAEVEVAKDESYNIKIVGTGVSNVQLARWRFERRFTR